MWPMGSGPLSGMAPFIVLTGLLARKVSYQSFRISIQRCLKRLCRITRVSQRSNWAVENDLAVHECTGAKKYLDGAITIWEWLAGGHEDAFHFTTAGKGGWGSAMLFRTTGDKRYLEKCLSQMEFILSCQQPGGWMLGPGTADFNAQPIRTTYDFTADFTSWLIDSSLELAYMGM